ncbi:MAG: UPF0175 family protein [Pirellulales bacterium]|nr:UPF0175 family protein [Pirellulales bacterium]
MSVTFDLPPELELQLRQDLANLDLLAKEAAMVELYRLGKLSHVELSTVLRLDRFATDALLKQYHVIEDLQSVEEFKAESEALHKLLDG